MKKDKNILYKIINLIGLAAIILYMAACSNDTASTNQVTGMPNTYEITISKSGLNPETITITKGTTITWINKDAVIHEIRSGTPASPRTLFDSDIMQSRQTYKYTFTIAGTYEFYDEIHPALQGTIIVE